MHQCYIVPKEIYTFVDISKSSDGNSLANKRGTAQQKHVKLFCKFIMTVTPGPDWQRLYCIVYIIVYSMNTCATLASSPVFMFMATILRSGNICMCNPCLIAGVAVGRQSRTLLHWFQDKMAAQPPILLVWSSPEENHRKDESSCHLRPSPPSRLGHPRGPGWGCSRARTPNHDPQSPWFISS